MLENGIYLPPSQFEAAFLSVAHTEEDVDATIAAAAEGLRRGGARPDAPGDGPEH